MAAWARKTFIALENREYRLLWFGSVLMFAGMQMQIIARGFLAFDLTGTNTALGGVMLGFAIPMMALSLWGGVVADRFPKRRLLILAQTVISLNAGAIALLIAFDVIEYWMLIVSSSIQGVGFSFIGPARMAFTGNLVGKERIGNAVALQQLSMRSTQVIGPALAGFLIGVYFVGLSGVYFITTAMFGIGVIAMLFLPAGDPSPRAEQRSPVRDLVDGLGYVRRNSNLVLLILTSFVVIALGFPFQAFLPSVATDVFDRGSTGLGMLSSATAIGAIIATVLVATYSDHPRIWHAQLALAVAMGVGLIVLGLSPWFLLVLLVSMPLLGAFSSGFQSVNASIVMTITDQEYQGRVQSIMMLGFSLSGLASFPIGILADAVGIMTAFALLGAIMIAVVVLLNAAGVLAGVRVRLPSGASDEVAPAPAGGGGR